MYYGTLMSQEFFQTLITTLIVRIIRLPNIPSFLSTSEKNSDMTSEFLDTTRPLIEPTLLSNFSNAYQSSLKKCEKIKYFHTVFTCLSDETHTYVFLLETDVELMLISR